MRVICAVLAALVGMILLPPAPALARVKFRFPVADPTPIWVEMLLHVDQDPAIGDTGNFLCLAHDCTENFPSCYDQHRGTDFVLEGGWEAMDQGTVQVVAAASGTVIRAEDGNYDRCHANLSTQQVDCDGHPMKANLVGIRHDDGTITLYYHLKKGSVAVSVGQAVACGDVLGLVGSSGNSSMPHVHFQVEDPTGAIIDPYSGACSHADTWWVMEEAGNGLPGPWCEGEVIAEPVVEAADLSGIPEMVEIAEVPEAVDVVEPGDVPAVDAGADGAADVAAPDIHASDAVAADPDPGVADRAASEVDDEDARIVVSLPGGIGCAAGGAPGNTGAASLCLVLAGCALCLGLRRRPL